MKGWRWKGLRDGSKCAQEHPRVETDNLSPKADSCSDKILNVPPAPNSPPPYAVVLEGLSGRKYVTYKKQCLNPNKAELLSLLFPYTRAI